MGSARRGSNPLAVVFCFAHALSTHAHMRTCPSTHACEGDMRPSVHFGIVAIGSQNRKNTRDGTRTRNLLLRREAPYPLGHTSSGSTANASRQIAVLRCVSNTGRRGRSCRCLPWKSACHLEEVQARRGAAAPRQHAPEAMIAWVRDGDAAARLRFSMAVAPLGLRN